MIDKITSKANARVKLACEIAKKPTKESFIIEGYHLVEMAYSYGCLKEVFTADKTIENVKCHVCYKEIIEKICVSKNPEPICGIASMPLKESEINSNKVLVLDRVQDPGNVGTLLRTALSFGFKDVVFLPGTCSPWNSKVIAASQGAIFPLNFHFPSSNAEFAKYIKGRGYFLIGSALRNSEPLESFSSTKEKIALVLGNEGQGMDDDLINLCDACLKISMFTMESLNVGVAGGILMHYFREK